MNLERVQKYYELIDRELGLESEDDLFGFESEEDDLFGFEADDDLFGFEADEDDLFGFESGGMSRAFIVKITNDPTTRMLIDPKLKRATLASIKKFENKVNAVKQIVTPQEASKISEAVVSRLSRDKREATALGMICALSDPTNLPFLRKLLAALSRVYKLVHKDDRMYMNNKTDASLLRAVKLIKMIDTHGWAGLISFSSRMSNTLIVHKDFAKILSGETPFDPSYLINVYTLLSDTISMLVSKLRSTFKNAYDNYVTSKKLQGDDTKHATRTIMTGAVENLSPNKHLAELVQLLSKLAILLSVGAAPKVTASVTLALNKIIASKKVK